MSRDTSDRGTQVTINLTRTTEYTWEGNVEDLPPALLEAFERKVRRELARVHGDMDQVSDADDILFEAAEQAGDDVLDDLVARSSIANESTEVDSIDGEIYATVYDGVRLVAPVEAEVPDNGTLTYTRV